MRPVLQGCLAKIAADLDKPDGLTLLHPRDLPGRRRLRAAGDLRGAGGARRGLRHPHPGEQKLELVIEDVLLRSPGRPSRKPLIRYKSFDYQVASWTTPRRIVASHLTR